VATLALAKDEVFNPATVTVSNALKNHAETSAATAGLCCAALTEIVGRLHAAKASSAHIAAGSLEWVLKALNAHLGHAHTGAECLKVVWLLAVPDTEKDLVASVALDTVILVLGANGKDNELVAEYGAGALWSFGQNNVETRYKILTRGAASVVQSTMQKHMDDSYVVKQVRIFFLVSPA